MLSCLLFALIAVFGLFWRQLYKVEISTKILAFELTYIREKNKIFLKYMSQT